MTTWYVLGATSPLARAFAIEAAGHGAKLVLAARDTDELETIAGDLRLRREAEVSTEIVDAAKPESVSALAARIKSEAAPLALFIGHGIMPDEADHGLTSQLWQVNTLSIINLLNELTAKLEADKAGQVVVVGSVAGDRGRASNYQYGATKAGLAAFVEGFGQRMSRAGVKVLLVKPGMMDTRMTWGMKASPIPLGTPEGLAKAMWKKAAKGGTLYYPWFWFFIMKLIRELPHGIFNKTKF
jgi:short-subunit dehydrogenase